MLSLRKSSMDTLSPDKLSLLLLSRKLLLCCRVAPIFCEYSSANFYSRAHTDFWSTDYMANIQLKSATTTRHTSLAKTFAFLYFDSWGGCPLSIVDGGDLGR